MNICCGLNRCCILKRMCRLPDRTAIVGGYRNGLEQVRDLFCETTGGILRRIGKSLDGTLDFDASCIYGDKRCDECLSEEHGNKRLPTIVREIMLVPGRIVVKGHRMMIDLPVYLRHLVKEYRKILERIATGVRALPRCAFPVSFSQVIFRRE
ncbi:MAG: hypothetical protein HYX78_08595 [Armatimonadetes bacterium]|nr:hypothetical protein [Armatimonadota bacterium]